MNTDIYDRIQAATTPEAIARLLPKVAEAYHEQGLNEYLGDLLQSAIGKAYACEFCNGEGEKRRRSGIGSPADSDIETCRECGGSGMRDEV